MYRNLYPKKNHHEPIKIACPKYIVNFVTIAAACIAIIWDTQCFLFILLKKISIICAQKRKFVGLVDYIMLPYECKNSTICKRICKRKLDNKKDLFTRSNSNDISGIIVEKNIVL